MPCIEFSLTQSTTLEQRDALKDKMGKAITLLSGKTEEYLMVVVNDNQHIYLAGRTLDNGACVKVYHFGDADAAQLKQLGLAIVSALQEILGIEPNDAYVIFAPGIENWTLFGDTYHTDIFARK